jgi:hypothetical protein
LKWFLRVLKYELMKCRYSSLCLLRRNVTVFAGGGLTKYAVCRTVPATLLVRCYLLRFSKTAQRFPVP